MTDDTLMDSVIAFTVGTVTMWVLEACGFPQIVKIAKLHERMERRKKRRDPRRFVMLNAKACCRSEL